MRQAYRDATKDAFSCNDDDLLQNLQKKQVEGACPLRVEGRLDGRPSSLIERNSSLAMPKRDNPKRKQA